MRYEKLKMTDLKNRKIKKGHLSDPLVLFETTSAYSLVVIRCGNIVSLFSMGCNRKWAMEI